jgi:hypothetical protein
MNQYTALYWSKSITMNWKPTNQSLSKAALALDVLPDSLQIGGVMVVGYLRRFVQKDALHGQLGIVASPFDVLGDVVEGSLNWFSAIIHGNVSNGPHVGVCIQSGNLPTVIDVRCRRGTWPVCRIYYNNKVNRWVVLNALSQLENIFWPRQKRKLETGDRRERYLRSVEGVPCSRNRVYVERY